jgi:phosphomannomutase
MRDLFKTCDVRGVYGVDLTEADARRIGAALAGWLRSAPLPDAAGRRRIAVGSDVRAGGHALKAALLEGIRDTGIAAVDLGTLPTPMLHFGAKVLRADAAVMVTGGHSPPEYNGIKFLCRGWPLMPGDLATLADLAEDEATLLSGGTVETADVRHDYQNWLLGAFAGRLPSLHVVVDPGNGAWAGSAGRLMTRLGLRVSAISDRPDGRFPDRPADSAHPDTLRRLGEAVTSAGADLGIAFDADGDRVNLCDEAGTPVGGETVGVLLLRGLLGDGKLAAEAARNPPPVLQRPWIRRPPPGAAVADRAGSDSGNRYAAAAVRIVCDIKSGRALTEEVRRLGGLPVMEKTANTFLRHRVRSLSAPLGIAVAGHYYWGELDGGDDGLYSALRLLSDPSRAGRPLSKWAADVPRLPSTPELRVPCGAGRAEAICESLALVFGGEAEVSRVDGVRLDFRNGWALLRPSATESSLTVRFEGVDPAGLDAVVREVGEQLPREVRKPLNDLIAASAGRPPQSP